MSHLPINHSDVPIRLFKSDFLEFFSHISPVTVVVIWLPVSFFFLIKGIIDVIAAGAGLWIVVLSYLFGIFLWSFSEYILHRFVFHFPARNAAQERIIFLFHGVHHAQPQCKTRLVMPPAVSIPLAVLFYGLFTLIFGVALNAWLWIFPMFAGFIDGYLIYDLTHYATHHFKMRWGFLFFLKRYHMQHHYKTPNARFGVSSPLWDTIFGTFVKE